MRLSFQHSSRDHGSCKNKICHIQSQRRKDLNSLPNVHKAVFFFFFFFTDTAVLCEEKDP